MNSRFITLQAYNIETAGAIVYDIKINPFSIECFYNTNDILEGFDATCIIITKTGLEFSIACSAEELEKILNQ
jgi:hypothetical protein